MSLDEKLRVQYDYAAGVDKQMAKAAFDEFISKYKLELLGRNSVKVSAELWSPKPLLKISSQTGSELAAVLLREEYTKMDIKSPEIFFSGAVGRKVFFYSEKCMYEVTLRRSELGNS